MPKSPVNSAYNAVQPDLILPGACIGIIGGGQLGKMLAIAAAELGYRTHVYCPAEDNPAFQVATLKTRAPYDDLEALKAFAQSCDVITLEFENIPVQTLRALEADCPVRPGPQALYLSQNRLREKRFAKELGIPCCDFYPVHSADTLADAYNALAGPCILKTTELGYDGKGQLSISEPGNWEQIWAGFATEAILEARVAFRAEISCIVARGTAGQTKPFPIGDNEHVNGILSKTTLPSVQDEAIQLAAQQHTIRLANALDLVGLLAVEYFVCADGSLLFNEMAPRPHNSGHWTQDACLTSQFEQAIRAITGLSLAPTDQTAPVVMRNLVGDDITQVQQLALSPQAKLHVYGKHNALPGRKMGHVNFVGAPADLDTVCVDSIVTAALS